MSNSLESYLISAFASVAPKTGCAYVAGPLATGKTYYDHIARGEDNLASLVRGHNEKTIELFVNNLRYKLSYPIIDPGLLKIQEWSSRETGEFFLKVIKIFAKETWFINGWEYSRGATKEFEFCLLNGIPCLDENGKSISQKEAIEMISDVVTHLKENGIPADRFQDRLKIINTLK